MKKFIYVAIAVIAMGMASCSTGNYVTTSHNMNLNQTQVVLSEANFKVVKQVSTSVVYKQNLKFDAEQLKQIYNNGVTIWHYRGADFNYQDYTKENWEVSLLN